LLPGAEGEAAVDYRHRLRRTDQRRPLVGVRVGVVVEPVVLVLALRRNQPLEHLPQVVHPARLELHRRDRRGRATYERQGLTMVDFHLCDDSLHVAADVDHVAVPLGRKA
jgi:hypothetical protein